MNIKRSIAKRVNKIFGSRQVTQLNKPIENLFNTNYGKRVLISYIMAPFKSVNSFVHQNYLTSHIVAECFSELGYDIDIIDFQGDFDINYDAYSVIFGFGINFERSFYSKNRNIPHIHFMTGAHQDLQNSMSLKSVKDFYKISGLWMPAEANVLVANCYYSTFNSDASIILAQGFIYEDHKHRVDNRLYSLNNNILGVFKDFKPKNLQNNNFLYLSGSRLITKGLHLLLEVAKQRQNLNFYIVVFSIEEELHHYYGDLLSSCPNVFIYQNLRMDSEEMRKIVETCSYVVAPSYTDGLPGGTIEPMSAGLIPIVSRYCGFPREEFIFEMDELSVSGLNETIDRVLKLDDQSYLNYSNTVKAYTQEAFSVTKVKENLLKILKTEL